jgi:hypothetical protein
MLALDAVMLADAGAPAILVDAPLAVNLQPHRLIACCRAMWLPPAPPSPSTSLPPHTPPLSTSSARRQAKCLRHSSASVIRIRRISRF